MIDLITRARNYVSKMPAAVSGSGGHDATFEVAAVLVRGFCLPLPDAEAVLREYNQRCTPPWSDRELAHKLRQAQHAQRPEGYLLGDGNGGRRMDRGEVSAPARRVRAEFDPERLRREAGEMRGRVDLVWLANRSEVDPAEVDSDRFLQMMYRKGERVVLFTDEMSQGQAMWPDEDIPVAGAKGMWYLIQPVDGKVHPNPRTGTESRRSEESVTAWRYLLLESDKAGVGDWLAALAKFPARIAAIYSSGGRSVHALVKVDCKTKAMLDEKRARFLASGFGRLGGDEGALTGVRLSRLPGQPRPEKGSVQKLLYVRSFPLRERLDALPVKRDVEALWMQRGEMAYRTRDAAAMRWAAAGLEYYGRVRERMAAGARDLREALELMGLDNTGDAR